MGMLSLLSRPATQASVSWSPLDQRWYADVIGTRSDAGPVIVPENLLTNAVAYRATNVLAHSIASVPLVVYRRRGDDGKERAREHMAYGILHDKPNRWQTSFRWRHLMMTHAIIWGDHYSEIMPGPGGIGALVPLNPDTTRIVDQLRDGELVYITRDKTDRGYGPERKLLQREVLHIRGFSIDGKRGIPMTKVARNAMGLALAAERHGSLFMRRGAKFSGFLKIPGMKQDSPEHKAAEAAWQKMQQEGSATSPLLAGEASFEKMSYDNRATQWIEARTFQVEELLRFFGVPGVLVGYADKTSTYASAEQFFLSFVTHTILPWTENIAQELNDAVVLDHPEFFVEFRLEGLLKGDIKTRYAAHQLAILTGFKNRNEVRIEESYNRGPDALDEFLEPANMLPAGEEREAAAPARLPAPGRSAPAGDDEEDDDRETAQRAQLHAIARGAVTRLVQKEVSAICGGTGRLGAAGRFAGNQGGWYAWLTEFYAEQGARIIETLGVSEDMAVAYCTGQRERLRNPASAGDTFEADSIAAMMRLIPGD